MTLRHAFQVLTVCVSLLPAASGFGRGGETGTLDEEPDMRGATGLIEINRMPTKSWSPHYMSYDHFRRLRARLSLQPVAPIPGWDSRRAWKHDDRYFTEDGLYELLPIVPEMIR